MPQARHRTTTTTTGATTVPITPGMGMRSPTRGSRPAKRGNSTTPQYLALERTAGNQVITKNLTAGKLASFVNALCAVDSKTPGVIASDPSWAYNLGEQMFGAD